MELRQPLVMRGKFIVWTAVVKLFRYPLTTAILVGVGLTQIGEFSFILMQVARANGLVNEAWYSARPAASLHSILANAALVGPLRRHCRRFSEVYH